MKNQPKVRINDQSIETAGLPSDYKEAISEFIWNSFDAKARTVSIIFDDKDPIGHISSLSISDNGEGIFYDNLSNTFGVFLDSQKRGDSYQRSSYTHGRKGKGRFSFETFASKAIWKTKYKTKDGNFGFQIEIDATDKTNYIESPKQRIDSSSSTGTEVVFSGIHSIGLAELISDEFLYFLKKEFGWFLFLNNKNNFQIILNGKILDYSDVIADTEQENVSFKDSKDNNSTFCITYVRWASKIGDKFYFYFLNSKKYESGKILTSFNNKSDEFNHSLYIESDYFDDFTWATEKQKEIIAIIGKSQSDKAFRELTKYLTDFLSKKRKEFIRSNSEKIISRFEDEGVMPHFEKNKYDEARKQDFEEVVKEMYAVEPKIFIDLGKEQKQTFLGLLNLVLDSEERENVMKIIDGVVSLSKDERVTLSNILKKTTLSRIIRAIKLIEQRYEVVESLKTLVFDLKKFTTERDHIQEIIENNYWLFGEQYNLISADKTFEEAISEYLYILDDKKEEKGKYKISNKDLNRRPDIFLCRKRVTDDSQYPGNQIEESVIVELKSPSVNISVKEYRQVEDYLNIVVNEDKFNSTSRKWRFYLVSNKIEEDVKKRYDAFKEHGKRYLVYTMDKYEIYALTWDDLFVSFQQRHSFISEKLEFDRRAIREELELQGIQLSRETSDQLTSRMLYK